MKKLITIITTILALTIGAIGISAAPAKPKVKPSKKPVVKKRYNNGHSNGYYNGHYNRRGVYIYTTTRIVHKRNGKFRNTYKHKVFPNGRHKVKLIKSVRLRNWVYPVRVSYQKKVMTFGGSRYMVVYKITKYSNGRVQKVIHSREPLGRRHNRNNRNRQIVY